MPLAGAPWPTRRDVNLVVQRDNLSLSRFVRKKHRREVLIRRAGPIKWTIEGGAAGHLFEGGMVFLAVRHGIDGGAGIGLRGFHVA